jgi:hypothetical protein
MTPEEKAVLDRRARQAGLSTSEFVRRRVSEDDGLEEHREEIEALLAIIERSLPDMSRHLDSAIATSEVIIESLNKSATGRTNVGH